MPKYTVKDPETGRTVTLTGDSPPTEAELTDIFAAVGKSSAPPPADFSATNQKDAQGNATAVDPEALFKQESAQKNDVATGILKGMANTAFGLGKIAHDYTPLGRLSDAIQPGAFDQRPDYTQPTNTNQRVGFTGEQVGEFFIPGSTAARLGKTANVAKDAGLAYAQSGSPAQAGVAGALTAVLPGGQAISRAAEGLESSAQKSMVQALGATKEWAKAESAKLAPQMLKRGIGGSRAAMLDTAKATAARVGGELDDAYRLAAQAGETVPALVIQGNVQLAAEALQVADAKGVLRTIPGTEHVVQRLNDLGEFVASLGSDIPVDKAAQIKRTWDQIVSKAGLYGQKAGASASDSSTAWALREAAGSFRELLNQNPTIEALNHEAAFWVGLKNVLKETQKRTQAQGGGLIAAGMGGSGAVIGALSGDSASDRATKAFLGGLAGRQFVKLVQSPAFRTQVSAPMKQFLADALASGSAGRVAGAVNRIVTSLPAQYRALEAQ